MRGGVNVYRRARIAAAKRAAELLRQIIELGERGEKRQHAVDKRHAALMREFERHARLEESALPSASEVKAALAVMFAARRLVDRFELEVTQIYGQQSRLLEELRHAWRLTEAHERARQVKTFSFWLKKRKGEEKWTQQRQHRLQKGQ
jgi:hypothetical protein